MPNSMSGLYVCLWCFPPLAEASKIPKCQLKTTVQLMFDYYVEGDGEDKGVIEGEGECIGQSKGQGQSQRQGQDQDQGQGDEEYVSA